MKLKFTDETVAALICPPDKKDILRFDKALAGFGVRVTKDQTKLFLAQYTAVGVKRRVPIGRLGDWTTTAARKKAKAILGQVANGGDPFAEDKAKEAAARAERAAEKARAAEAAFTLEALIDWWEGDRTKAGKRPGYLKPAVASLKRHFSFWLERPASSITEPEAARRLEKIETEAGPMASVRVLAYARAAYGRALRRKLVNANPFAGIEPVAGETSRERVLNEQEIGEVWRAAHTLPPPYNAYIKTLLLTGQRRNEVAGMRWGELSPGLTTWILPSARVKNREGHVVALAEPVREMLASQLRIRDCPYVFPGERGNPICAFSFAKRLVDSAIRAEREEAGTEPADPPPWTFHDARRSMATWMASVGIPSDVADRILNHREGRATGVKGVYQRYEFGPERQKALAAWATHVLACAGDQQPVDNVITLKAG